jgi:DNA-binding NarL/FixJ family response regulator
MRIGRRMTADPADSGEGRAATEPDAGGRIGAHGRRTAANWPRVVLIETNTIAGLGLTRVLGDHGIEVVGETYSVEVGLTLARRSAADVVLVDVHPGSLALQVLAEIVRSFPPARVVMLHAAADVTAVLAALGAGASGCVAREAPERDVVDAVEGAVRGESFISPMVAGRLRRRLGLGGRETPGGAPVLTDRERDVLRLLARGFANSEIAKALYLSPATVKHHIASIFSKLAVRNRIQAAVRAVEDGLLDDV